MECERLAAQLDAYLADGLSDSELSEIRKHMEGCGYCRNLIPREKELNRVIRSSVDAATPPVHSVAAKSPNQEFWRWMTAAFRRWQRQSSMPQWFF